MFLEVNYRKMTVKFTKGVDKWQISNVIVWWQGYHISGPTSPPCL